MVKVFLDFGELILIFVVVGPSLVLFNTATLVINLLTVVHLLVLVAHIYLVAEHLLSVGSLLGSPSTLLVVVVCSRLLIVAHLLGTSGVDVVDLVGAQTLEMVGHVTVSSEFALGCHGILSHDVAMVGLRDLSLVHALLVVFPAVLGVTLGLSKSFILLLEFLHHAVSLLSHFIIKHASHTVNVVRLLGIGSFVLSFLISIELVLALLLLNPVALV